MTIRYALVGQAGTVVGAVRCLVKEGLIIVGLRLKQLLCQHLELV